VLGLINFIVSGGLVREVGGGIQTVKLLMM